MRGFLINEEITLGVSVHPNNNCNIEESKKLQKMWLTLKLKEVSTICTERLLHVCVCVCVINSDNEILFLQEIILITGS